MRLALVHNPDAGRNIYSAADVARLLRGAGHEVRLYGKKRRELKRAIGRRPDILVVAGGDGTVAKAAIALHERGADIPLYVLPLGTSNNIGLSLGALDSIPVLVENMGTARDARLDIGTAAGPWGDRAFVESTGVGFLGTALHGERTWRARVRQLLDRARRRRPKGEAEVQAAARRMADRIRHQPVRYYSVMADGRDLSGEYLAAEAMNIGTIGPRLSLAPTADPGDGLLDLVLVRSDQREPLARAIESGGDAGRGVVDCHRVREATLSWPSGHGHADDRPWPRRDDAGERSAERRVRASIQGTVRVLRPVAARARR